MRRLALIGIVLTVAAAPAAAALATSGGAAARPRVESAASAVCALGRNSPTNAAIEQLVLNRARTGFEQTLLGVSSPQRAAAGRQFTGAVAAYVYGYPIVIVRRTIATFPVNHMISIGRLADTKTVSIVAPNHDTLYSVAQLDLAGGPVVIHTPPTLGRYSVIQLTDAFTNVAAYLGDGPFSAAGETAAIAAPGWHGTLPAGLRVIRPATKLVWLLGRTLVSGRADTTAATHLLTRYSVTPLAAYDAGARTAPIILADFPHRTPVTVPSGTTFFDELSRDLAADPPPRRDGCAIAAFAQAGIGAARQPSKPPRGLQARALAAAARQGSAVLGRLAENVRHQPALLTDGWATTPADTARFGTDYLDRAVVARIGLGANVNAKALYLSDDRDFTRHALSGAHTYTVHFKRGQLPPVASFWSLTLYNGSTLFYANRLDRYALGDRSPGLRRAADGGLTIIVSHRAPSAAMRSNWLPAPVGAFSLYLRLYNPRPAALSQRWRPPPIVRRSPVAGAALSAGPRQPRILWDPIPFGPRRKAEMGAYVRRHYGRFMKPTWRLVEPHVIVIHYTDSSYGSAFNSFANDVPDYELHELPASSAHFIIDSAGRIHQLVSLGTMARHAVGLNWTAIGIEHVGYSDAQVFNDRAQIAASLRLVDWLRCRFHIKVQDVIGHAESLSSPYHHEDVPGLRTQTHGDFVHADMNLYRRRLRALGGC